jgi:hypothetical protein
VGVGEHEANGLSLHSAGKWIFERRMMVSKSGRSEPNEEELLQKLLCPPRDELSQWLAENTSDFNPEKSVTLSSFSVNWGGISGSCLVRADDEKDSVEITFSYNRLAWPGWSGPYVHSPLGVPATYATVRFSTGASEAITHGLRELLPTIKPFGRDDDGGVLLLGASMEQRLPADFDIDLLRRKLTDPSFELFVAVRKSEEPKLQDEPDEEDGYADSPLD